MLASKQCTVVQGESASEKRKRETPGIAVGTAGQSESMYVSRSSSPYQRSLELLSLTPSHSSTQCTVVNYIQATIYDTNNDQQGQITMSAVDAPDPFDCSDMISVISGAVTGKSPDKDFLRGMADLYSALSSLGPAPSSSRSRGNCGGTLQRHIRRIIELLWPPDHLRASCLITSWTKNTGWPAPWFAVAPVVSMGTSVEWLVRALTLSWYTWFLRVNIYFDLIARQYNLLMGCRMSF